jgi:hypothetical protein
MEIFKKAVVRLAHSDMKNHASFLKWLTLIIWACSLIAEVGTFAYNKNLPKKQKRFIIQQELVAGGISLGMMYLLADRFQKFGDWLVASGRLLPKDLPQRFRSPDKLKKLLTEDKKGIEHELNGHSEWSQKLLHFQKGSSVIFGTVGTIIAFNIISPLVSNKIAATTDKFFAKKEGDVIGFKNGQPSQQVQMRVTATDQLGPQSQKLYQSQNIPVTIYRAPSPSFGYISAF